MQIIASPVIPLNNGGIAEESRQFFRDFLYGTVNQLENVRFTGKSGLGFDEFSDLPVESFDGIGGVNQPSNLARILKIIAQILPI